MPYALNDYRPVRSQKNELVVGVQSSNISLDVVAVKVVHQSELKVRRWLTVGRKRQACWRGRIDGIVMRNNKIVLVARCVDHRESTDSRE